MILRPFAADGTDDSAAYDGVQDGGGVQDESFRLAEADINEFASAGRRTPSLDERRNRDALLTGCVKQLKMSAPQILSFSRAWGYPFHSESDVWRRVNALGLGKRIRHVARQSLHDEWMLNVFIKIARDAIRNNLPVFEIAKEFRIGEGSGIRSDMRWRIQHRLFFLEAQQSSLTYLGWKAKLSKYVRYRRQKGVRPFRVLIAMEDEQNLNTVLGYAKEVLAPFPSLTLFLFAYMPDLLNQYDTVTEEVWRSHRYEALSLM